MINFIVSSVEIATLKREKIIGKCYTKYKNLIPKIKFNVLDMLAILVEEMFNYHVIYNWQKSFKNTSTMANNYKNLIF